MISSELFFSLLGIGFILEFGFLIGFFWFIIRTQKSNTDSIVFLDKSGKKINKNEYDKFVICGNSLEPFNIPHRDLVFSKRLTRSEYFQLDLPKPCIFHSDAKYTTGVVFGRYNPETDNLNGILENIFNNKSFDKFRKDPRYVSDKFISDNLEVPENSDNISLFMKLNENNKFILKGINSKDIFGYIKYSFTLKWE